MGPRQLRVLEQLVGLVGEEGRVEGERQGESERDRRPRTNSSYGRGGGIPDLGFIGVCDQEQEVIRSSLGSG